LVAAEAAEVNPHLQDDYRIARITVANAAQCVPEPHVVATYAVLGLHPLKVWPAIIERRKALLGPFYVDESLPPKKPVESVRLIEESRRRVVGEESSGKRTQRGIVEIPRRLKRVEEPGMAASTARAYRNSERAKSENPSLFSVRQLVESSTWPAEYRALLLAMLEKNQFGTELWYSQLNLSRDLGKSYSTVRRMMRRLREGHHFGKKNIVHCPAVLEKTIDANMRPNGELRRSTTYRLHRQNLNLRPTPKEIRERSVGAFCPLPMRPDRPIPPSPSPASARPEHRSSQRETRPQPKLAKSETTKLVANVLELMKGRTTTGTRFEGIGGNLSPGDPGYRAPMKFRAALEAVCEAWKRTPESVLEALKFWGYKFEESEGP
jgi:hypothetical protein